MLKFDIIHISLMGCWLCAKMVHNCLQCIFWQFLKKMHTSENSAQSLHGTLEYDKNSYK